MLSGSQQDVVLLVPPGVALTTVALRVFIWGRHHRRAKHEEYLPLLISEEDGEDQNDLKVKDESDGLTVLSFRLTRLICAFILLSLSVREVIVDSSTLAIKIVSLVFYVYVELLSSLSVLSTSNYWRTVASLDASLSLFVAFVVYFIRDLWPYAIAYPIQSHSHDWVTWTRIALLALSGVVIPLFIPPSQSSASVETDMGYSLFSTISFGFLDRIIFYANRTMDFKLDDLPPIPNSHRAVILAKLGLPKLDPLLVGKRHLILGMFNIFYVEWIYMFSWELLYAVSKYIGPYGMKNLLTSLETSDLPSRVLLVQTGYLYVATQVVLQTWFWIAVVSLAPLITSILQNRYFYNETFVEMREDSLLTQLIFEHTLRIRLKSDVRDSKKESIAGMPTIETTVALTGSVPAEAMENAVASSGEEELIRTSLAESSLDNTPCTSSGAPSETQASSSDVDQGMSKKAAGASSSEIKTDGEKEVPLLGKINNLITTDINEVKVVQESLGLVTSVIQIGIGIWFLYGVLGWSAFVGLAVFIVTIPVPTILGKMVIGAQRKKMQKTDQRIQVVTETVQILRTLKLLAWEGPTLKQLSEKRRAELKWVLRGKLLDLCMNIVEMSLPLVSLLATLATYALIQKQPLTAARAFPALSVFDVLQNEIMMIMYLVPKLLRSKVSFDRFNEFLYDTEVLVPTPMVKLASGAEPESKTNDLIVHPVGDNDRIGFCNASFSWTESSGRLESNSGSRVSLSNRFELRLDNEVLFKQGKMNLIVGPTASGKTSLLMALLGEMYYIPHGATSWYNLPRDRGVAYAPQESWVINATIKENIVFNQTFDEVRYRKVLKQCSLERDLSLWQAGDMTEVGEKGLTLSGGQKARVTLARALYSSASIVLLDDPLAALDVHTAKDVVNSALRGDLVRNRTIILVTHNIPLAGPLADHVIALGKDGRVVSQGSINEALRMDEELRALADNEQATIEIEEKAQDIVVDDTSVKDRTAAGKLIVAEEKAMGHVEWTAVKLFVDGVGGVFSWSIVLSIGILSTLITIGETWSIGYWAAQYDDRPASEVSALRYLALYAAVVLVGTIFKIISEMWWAFRTTRASNVIHGKLMQHIMNAPVRWLDTVPVGRITTRCTQDITAVDSSIPNYFGIFILFTMRLLAYLFVTVIMTGWPALVSGVLTTVMGGWLGLVYLRAQLCVKREWSNAKSPVVSQIGTVLSSIITIRAYSAQAYFRRELSKRLDDYSRAGRTHYDLNRWISFRIDVLSSVFAAVVTSYLVYGQQLGPSTVGFTLTMTLAFTGLILWWVRVYNILEVECNSLERILDFLRIDQEPQPVESGKPPAYWPSSGNLKVEKLSASYSNDGPLVLRDISFEIKSGERVGIVGRTGAGKSSITLALLRAIKTTGKVYYDNLATDNMNLDALRSNMTLIPQQPELIRGTLRENLDPFGDYDDAAMNDALRSAGLFDIGGQEAGENNQPDSAASSVTQQGVTTFGLDTAVESGGLNWSLGQRQIIALARAILRRSKILILDEATAAIDYKTDAAIQKSLRTELSKDTTVITIAHRLQTIMDSDKILVLDAGEVAEFDSPANLLKNTEGFLRSLVDASDDKDRLLEMAGVKPEEM